MSNLTIGREPGRLTLEGELDLASVPELEAAVAAVRGDGAAEVVIDLRELAFMDSSGLRCLVQLDDAARADGWQLKLVRGPDAVHRLLELTRMDQRLTFEEP
jgi:anti-sigma B factor antagonist